MVTRQVRSFRTHYPWSAITLALVAIAFALAFAIAQETPAEPSDQVELGLAVYKAQYCGVCHRLEAAGTRGTFGPTHDGMAAIAEERLADPSYAGSAETVEAYIRESIVDPMAFLVPGFAMTPHAMPSYSHLSNNDLDALVALLSAQ